MARCPATAAPRVDVIRVMDLLQTHITSALCRTVFRRVRIAERQRVWTLEALVWFWTAVILRAPAALSHALLDAVDARDPFVPTKRRYCAARRQWNSLKHIRGGHRFRAKLS